MLSAPLQRCKTPPLTNGAACWPPVMPERSVKQIQSGPIIYNTTPLPLIELDRQSGPI